METQVNTIKYSENESITFDSENKKIMFEIEDRNKILECNYNDILECAVVEDLNTLKHAVRQEKTVVETENKARRMYGCLNLHVKVVLNNEENPFYVLEIVNDFTEKYRVSYREKGKIADNIYSQIVNCMNESVR